MIAKMAGSLLVLTGASGAGKTTIADAVAERACDRLEVIRFDSIGVPTPEEMRDQYGSGEGWQRAMTHQWMTRLGERVEAGHDVLFEGQMRIAFIREALAVAPIANATCWLVDCADDERRHRLNVHRAQPELANSDMMNWARFLRAEAEAHRVLRLDTDTLSCKEAVDRILRYFGRGNAKP